MSARLYLPASVDDLRQLADAGVLDAAVEHVVIAASDSEDDEYAALMTAADASAERLSGAPGRRIVVVAELDEGPAGDAVVIRLRDVVALHADPDVRPADADPDDDLGWYATQEIDTLLG